MTTAEIGHQHITTGSTYLAPGEDRPLNVSTFFRKYILKPTSSEISYCNRTIALISSIALGILTLGLCHLFVRLCCYDPKCDWQVCVLESSQKARRQQSVANAAQTVLNPTEVSQPPVNQTTQTTPSVALPVTPVNSVQMPVVEQVNTTHLPEAAVSALPVPIVATPTPVVPVIPPQEAFLEAAVKNRISVLAASDWTKPIVLMCVVADGNGQALKQHQAIVNNESELQNFLQVFKPFLERIIVTDGELKGGGIEVLACRNQSSIMIDFARVTNMMGLREIKTQTKRKGVRKFQPTVTLLKIDAPVQQLIRQISPNISFN